MEAVFTPESVSETRTGRKILMTSLTTNGWSRK